MNSRIYQGRVVHARSWEAHHRLEYPVCFYAFDLDELDKLDRSIPLFGHNRMRLTALHDKDYLSPGLEPLHQKLRAVLTAHACADDIARVMLITSPRYVNYVFNPVSFFCCLRADGSIRCIVANVNNTFGDAHVYVLKDPLPPRPGFPFHFSTAKAFHVSPFFDLEGTYDFFFAPIGDSIDIMIRLDKQGTTAFVARLRGTGRALTTRNQALTLLRFPLGAFLTIPRICWQAARLHWQRKLPVHHRPNPHSPMTVRVAPPTWSRRWAMNGIARVFHKLTSGDLALSMPDRKTLRFGKPGTGLQVHVDVRNSDFFWRMATGSDIGLGEAYMAGDWECTDPALFLRLLLQNWDCIKSERGAWLARIIEAVRHMRRANTLSRSQRNISEHYDLSNEFFGLFLDETMTYSCARFPPGSLVGAHDASALATAQRAKMCTILDKAALGPDDHVLEIGCGWGALALEAVRRSGCRYTGITVSREQLKLARACVQAAGLADRIRIEFCDYRTVQGSFSRIISVEMLEAVGHQYLGDFFSAIDRVLLPGGHAVIQVITIPDDRYEQYRRGSDFIRKHIFPGGHLPSLAALRAAASRASHLTINEIESIGIQYPYTLRCWRECLLANAAHARKLGFDDVFLRKWEFYFAYCEAGFAEQVLDNVQFIARRTT